VLAAPDDDPQGEPVPRQVEEIFKNYLPTLDLRVNGRIIRTTAEHPFWVLGRGWVDAQRLEAGDQLRAHDGRWLEVEDIEGPMPSAPVYNMCVEEYHTYFVGHQVWGFAVWSHNIGCGPKGSNSGGSNAPNTSYERPSGFRKGVRDQVWAHAKGAGGRVRDPSTNKAMSPNKAWDMGHNSGYEFRKHQQSAMDRGISRKQFLDEYNKPGHYRPELPSSHRSHAGEDMTDAYFGD
jgi:hypothetical protein